MKVYIAGAHSRGRTLRVYLETLYPDIQVEAFLVDDMADNAETADGIPVQTIGDGLDTDSPVYVAMRSENRPKVIHELHLMGMKEIIPVTVELDTELRNAYVRKYFQSLGRSFWLIDDLGIKG
ncbi:MAG: hypothetical protein HFI64_12765 [Lachnospiraceae bacterium]|nr:hypothetical protein [Lachnospiraceae bacterium]